MHGEYKIPGGKLVVADIEVEDNRIVAVRLAGDFFLEPDDALDRMQGAIVGIAADTSIGEIVSRLDSALLPGDELFGISTNGVAMAVRRALGKSVDWDDLEFDVIYGPSVAPEINQALDESLVARVASGQRRPFLRMWEWNAPQVVIGSFQSYVNEIDPEGIARHDVQVTRRITGGGAMFMEPGNCVTYSLVVPTALVDGMSFEQAYAFLDQWAMEALEKCGVHARYVPLNDIASDAGKIGGAAQKRFANGYLLHHVTMAYDIDAEKMLDCIRIGKEKIKDKGTRSAAKRVDPMRSQTGMDRNAIIDVFLDHFLTKFRAQRSELTEAELAEAEELAEVKFRDPAWTHRVP